MPLTQLDPESGDSSFKPKLRIWNRPRSARPRESRFAIRLTEQISARHRSPSGHGIPCTEDEHDDEDEDDSKFRNLGLREQVGEVCQGIEDTIGTYGRVLQLFRPELSGTNQDAGTTRV